MSHRSLLVLSSLALAAAAHAQYDIVTIDTPGAQTFVQGINDSGQIAGYQIDGRGAYTGFAAHYDDTSVTPFDNAGYAALGVSGINSSGETSGVSIVANMDGSFTGKGFVRSPSGTFTTIDPGSPAVYDEAVALNDNGTVVGYYNDHQTGPTDQGLDSHGYRLKGGVYQTLDAPGGHGTQFYGVNDAETATGRFLDGNGVSHGFLYRDATGFVDVSLTSFFGTPLAGFETGGLNEHGDFTAVGYLPSALSPTGVVPVSFLNFNGTYVPFAVPGALATLAYDINDRGQVVGTYVTADAMGNLLYHGFSATPQAVPEPASLAALGLGALVLVRRRRRA